jgi:transcriptional regulator with XRE-family HTH domain
METRMSINQTVSWNLRRARELRGWTTEEAAQRLEPFLGQRWSQSTFSTAEAAKPRGQHRTRRFTVDDLIAFARAFELSVAFFLAPVSLGAVYGAEDATETTDRATLLELVVGLNEDARTHVLAQVPPEESGVLRKWEDDHAELVRMRKAHIASFLAAADELEERG